MSMSHTTVEILWEGPVKDSGATFYFFCEEYLFIFLVLLIYLFFGTELSVK